MKQKIIILLVSLVYAYCVNAQSNDCGSTVDLEKEQVVVPYSSTVDGTGHVQFFYDCKGVFAYDHTDYLDPFLSDVAFDRNDFPMSADSMVTIQFDWTRLANRAGWGFALQNHEGSPYIRNYLDPLCNYPASSIRIVGIRTGCWSTICPDNLSWEEFFYIYVYLADK